MKKHKQFYVNAYRGLIYSKMKNLSYKIDEDASFCIEKSLHRWKGLDKIKSGFGFLDLIIEKHNYEEA